MNPFEFVLVIVIAGLIYSAWKARHLAQHGMFEDKRGKVQRMEGGEREAALQHEVEELRERIKVLERIAIDDRGATRLSAEIDALRDTADKIEERSKQ